MGITIYATVPRFRTVKLLTLQSCELSKAKKHGVDTFNFWHKAQGSEGMAYEMFAKTGTFVAGAKFQATMTCHKDDLVFRAIDVPKSKTFEHDKIAYKVTYQKEGKMMIFERVEILLDTVPQTAVSAGHGAAAELSSDSGDQSSERLG